jgi:cell division protein FtsI/penicillin-binding protein 2
LLWLALLLAIAFLGLGYRLVELQALRHDELKVKAQQNTQQEFVYEPRRGDIFDVKGNPLATTVLVKTVCADPTFILTNQVEVAHVLAPLLEESETRLIQLLTPRLMPPKAGQVNTNKYCQFVPLKSKVPVETWQKIQAAMKGLSFGEERPLNNSEKRFFAALREKAIFARDEPLRRYPNGKLASHLLGFASSKERMVAEMPIKELEGKDGIELTYNKVLSGSFGWRVTETDVRKREQVTLRNQDVEPRDGYNVILTIDSVVQHIVESALAEAMEKHSPISASALVVRPKTGQILAMATLPDYDPNKPGDYAPDSRRNRIISDIAEPGSTFKVVVVSGALNDGAVRLIDSFDCEHGRFHFGGRILHDHESYGRLSVQQIITKSSNIGAAKVGIRLGEKRLYDYIRTYGFGSRTGIELPGEVFGIVHSLTNWSKVSIAQIPMGHGLSVTRLQMVMAMCAIANKGTLMRPMLVDRIESPDHVVITRNSPLGVRRVISEEAAKNMVTALKTVVSPEGTAPKAALESYTVAGKTGTAQKVENGVYVRKYLASFVGFFPADDPEVCISVVLDEPSNNGYYGGQTAAPIFKQIAERAANYLNIRPETPGESPAPKPADVADALKSPRD